MPSLKLISATDTEYSTAVLKSLNEQRNHGLFCDITIIIRDKKFRAHKTILSASSTYFHQLFTVAGQVIELNFIRAEIFEEILNYIYTSKIVRVRSDTLEELIHAGKILGVKFIANLATPLSHVKGLPGLSKEPENKTESTSEMMPIIAESFSISAEEFNQTSRPEGSDEDSDGDVMFVSQTTAVNKKISTEVIDLDSADSDNTNNADVQHEVTEPQKTYSVKPPLSNTKGSSTDDSNNLSIPGSEQTAPTTSTSDTHDASGSLVSSENGDLSEVHKNQVAAADQQADLNRGLVDVSDSPANAVNSSTCEVGANEMVTLKTAEEIGSIGSISPDCRVYTNIGENTFDVVARKDDPEEGGSTANNQKRSYMATLNRPSHETPAPPKAGPKNKKGKMEEDQFYELIMDGKSFYVCVVCKRPYVSMTSLRRHYNTHSWEKKYPCRHCDKVFALAEYRTKHEINHTGERRYQCLLCNETFLNYQFLSSHCRHVHNQDPCGRKAKVDADNNLYRLLPCKTVKMKPYSWVTDEPPSDIATVMTEDGGVHVSNTNEDDSQSRILNWDDIFMEPDSHSQPGSSSSNSNKRESELEFVIPDTF